MIPDLGAGIPAPTFSKSKSNSPTPTITWGKQLCCNWHPIEAGKETPLVLDGFGPTLVIMFKGELKSVPDIQVLGRDDNWIEEMLPCSVQSVLPSQIVLDYAVRGNKTAAVRIGEVPEGTKIYARMF